MAKIPFDIKFKPQIESGEYKVETRDGKPARIVCWDLKGNDDFFILALVEKNEKEASYCYPATGCCKASCDPEGKDDLFLITPEPEFTEFEKACIRLYQDGRDDGFAGNTITNEVLKESVAELLELAKKEQQEKVIHDYWKQAADRCVQAREEGKAEVLKGLPRWKVADRDIISNTIDFAEPYMHDGGDHSDWVEVIVTNVVRKGKNYLEISDLEKLPGFNG